MEAPSTFKVYPNPANSIINLSVHGELGKPALVRIFSTLLLHGFHIDYLYYFLFAMCGPIVGFVMTLFFPPTERDSDRMERMKRCCCCIEKETSMSREGLEMRT